MVGDKTVIVAGLGCRATCTAGSILSVVRQAADTGKIVIDLLAVPARRCDLPALGAAAEQLGLPIVAVDDPALESAQARCTTRSSRVHRLTGFSSVAEAAALAVAGSQARLLLARIGSGDVTCALAEGQGFALDPPAPTSLDRIPRGGLRSLARDAFQSRWLWWGPGAKPRALPVPRHGA